MRALPLAALALSLSLFTGCTTVRQLRAATAIPPDGKVQRVRNDVALDYSVATHIAASPELVWSVLTDVASYKNWNTTIVSLDGTCAKDGTLKLVAKVAPKRTFELKVSTFDPPKKMVWEDGGSLFLGVRNFTLLPEQGGTTFVMSETFSGGMLDMIEGSLPDFSADFEAFAADLKRTVEAKAGAGAAK